MTTNEARSFEEDERAAFEQWARSKKCPPQLLEMGGDYGGSGIIAGTWTAWQAGANWERSRRLPPGPDPLDKALNSGDGGVPAMKERPILFSGPMVRAILDGRKTQTRRVVRPQPSDQAMLPTQWSDAMPGRPNGFSWEEDDGLELGNVPMADGSWGKVRCPYGTVGDTLWARETWGWIGGKPSQHDHENGVPVFYRADHCNDERDGLVLPKWRPSIHMPRWASRITLEITGIRVERLQDISEEDAKAEGAECLVFDNCGADELEFLDLPHMKIGEPYRSGFALLWECINGPGSWDANPWVWVVSFRRLEA